MLKYTEVVSDKVEAEPGLSDSCLLPPSVPGCLRPLGFQVSIASAMYLGVLPDNDLFPYPLFPLSPHTR